MLLNIVFVIIGVIMVLVGADKLTDGSVALARIFSIPEMVIGLTIVAFGTSLPEFVVSLVASINNIPAMSVANIVGSNIFNTLVIVGATAITSQIAIPRSTIMKDIPFVLLASIVLFAFAQDSLLNPGAKIDVIDRGDGIALLAFFAIFMYSTIKLATNRVVVPEGIEQTESSVQQMSKIKITIYLIAGLIALIGGGQLFVEGASGIAHGIGISDAVIGLTLVAGGTSLPELATSVIAARKGQSGIAIGNVIGSNLFNIFWVLGACAVVTPLPVTGLTTFDFAMLVISSILFWLFGRTNHTINRVEGVILCGCFIAYISMLLSNL